MGTDVFLKVIDHLFSMLKILDGEKDCHRNGQETDQTKDDLKSETLVKLDFSHRRYPTSSSQFIKGGRESVICNRKRILGKPHQNFLQAISIPKFLRILPLLGKSRNGKKNS
jgi:hypothetical protein